MKNFHDVAHMKNIEREQDEIKKLQEQCIVKANHPRRQQWDILIVLITVYNSIQIPYEIAFVPTEEAIKNTGVNVINSICDLVFFLDIILNFHTTS